MTIKIPLRCFLSATSNSFFSLRASVALTQTEKRSTRDHKSAFIQTLRDNIDQYDRLYVFQYENMRSAKFKDVRWKFADSRIIMGKNKLMQIALGRSDADEYETDLQHVTNFINGANVGLLLTSKPRKEVEEYFQHLAEPDFARAGTVARRTITITNEDLEDKPVSLMEGLRKLGMPVEIKNGKIVLIPGEYSICKENDELTVEQCKLLVQFGLQLAEFRVKLVCHWSNGKFESLE